MSIIGSGSNALASERGEIEIRGNKVVLSQGEAMKVTLKTEESSTMNEVSFSVRTVGEADPFVSSRIPITVEVYESDQLVASESLTHSVGDEYEKVTVSINNIPKMDEKYKMLIRYDIPEHNGYNKPIQIDADSIRINEGEDAIEVHGKINLVFSLPS